MSLGHYKLTLYEIQDGIFYFSLHSCQNHAFNAHGKAGTSFHHFASATYNLGCGWLIRTQSPMGCNYWPMFYLPSHPDSKVCGTNMGPTWGCQGPGGPHIGPINLAIWDPMKTTWEVGTWVGYQISSKTVGCNYSCMLQTQIKCICKRCPIQDINDLVQDCSNSITHTLELLQTWTTPWIWGLRI